MINRANGNGTPGVRWEAPGLGPDAEAAGRLLHRVAESEEAISQALDTLDLLAENGILAAANAVLSEFDEAFSSLTRPEVMGLVANLMALLGALGRISYDPFFDTSMRVPAAIDEAWREFREKREETGLLEMLHLLRRPEVAGNLEILAAAARALCDETRAPAGDDRPAAKPPV